MMFLFGIQLLIICVVLIKLLKISYFELQI